MSKSFADNRVDKVDRTHWKDVDKFNVYYPEISRGDASYVYYAMNQSEKVVVKTYASEWMFDNAKILETELSNLQKLSTLGLVPKLLRKPLRTRNNIYLVMELCNCGSLNMWMKPIEATDGSVSDSKKKTPLPADIIRNISQFLASALIQFKGMKMLHREINPMHILANADDKGNLAYKLTGLHFCKDISKDKATSFVGTIDYIAPEASVEGPYDYAADMWSTGITLYELAMGSTMAKIDPQFRVRIKSGKCPLFPLKIDPVLHDLICKCLIYDPKKRLTPESMLDHPFLNGKPLASPAQEQDPEEWERHRKEKKRLKQLEEERLKKKKPVKTLTRAELLKMISSDFAKYMEYVNDTEDHKIKLKCETKTDLDPYVLKSTRPLSRGGFSEIYLCTHKATGEEFALKIVKTSKMTDVKIASLLLGEVEIMLELNLDLENLCPFGIKVQDYFVYSNKKRDPNGLPFTNDLCIILEYCNGGDLDDYIRKLRRQKKEFPLEELKLIAWNSACGLNEMHKRKMMHRDIKAKNILVVEDPTTKELIDIKLCDYGLSKKVAEHEELKGGTVLGTLDYFAPELYEMMEKRMRGDPAEMVYDYKVDVWSYGVLLYFALYGKTIMEPPGSKYSVMNQKKIKYPELPGVPEEYFNLLKSALTFDPKKRPSFSELLNDPFFNMVVIQPKVKLYPYSQGQLLGTSQNRTKVYKCQKGSKTYAMKVIENTDIDKKSLTREIDTLSKLKNNNNVIRLHDYFSISDKVHIIFDFYNGGNLEDYVIKRDKQKKSLSNKEAIFLAFCVLNGLKDIHTHNIIHRDIHPSNILLSVNEDTVTNAVISDFGFARILIDMKAATQVFTPYMSPEIMFPELGNSHNSKTDIWSFGMLVYFLIFGIHADKHKLNHNLAKMVRSGDVKYDEGRAAMYPELVGIFKRCLKVNPDERPTAPELLMKIGRAHV